MRLRLTSVLSALLGLFLFVSLTFAQRARQPQQQWEYKIIDFCRAESQQTDLQKLGEEGWELVSTDPPASLGEGSRSCKIYYFKRPKRYGTPVPPAAKPEIPKCSLGLAQAPSFRGLRLGMSTDEVTALFPNHRESITEAIKTADQPARYGLASLHLQSRGSGVEAIFEDVYRFTLLVLDGRVKEISVDFGANGGRPYFYWTHESLINRLAATFNLPGGAAWEKGGNYIEQRLACQGFEVVVSNHTSSYGSNGVISEPFNVTSLTIRDTSLKQTVEQRSQAYQELRRSTFKF